MANVVVKTITNASELESSIENLVRSALTGSRPSTSSLSAQGGPQPSPLPPKHVTPFVAVSATHENPDGTGTAASSLLAVCRYVPITHIHIMSYDGMTVLRCDLRSIMASPQQLHKAEDEKEAGETSTEATHQEEKEGQQQQSQQHPLAPLLRLLNGSDIVKIVDDGRGFQDAIATDLPTFDTAMLSNVIDVSILPIFFGYEDRYSPRFQRGVLRLPTAREAASFLRIHFPSPRFSTETTSSNSSSPAHAHKEKGGQDPISPKILSILEHLHLVHAIADAQLRPYAFRGANTTSTLVYKLKKQQKAMQEAQNLFIALRRQQREARVQTDDEKGDCEGQGNKKHKQRRGGGQTATSALDANDVANRKSDNQPAPPSAPSPQRLTQKELETQVSNCFARGNAINEEDTYALEALALEDMLAASRRFIDVLGDYQHPKILAKRADPTIDDTEAKNHLLWLLGVGERGNSNINQSSIQTLLTNKKRANYLPFGVLQPLLLPAPSTSSGSGGAHGLGLGGPIVSASSAEEQFNNLMSLGGGGQNGRGGGRASSTSSSPAASKQQLQQEALAYWARQRQLIEAYQFKHQQVVEQQRRDAAINATRGARNASLSRAVVDILGSGANNNTEFSHVNANNNGSGNGAGGKQHSNRTRGPNSRAISPQGSSSTNSKKGANHHSLAAVANVSTVVGRSSSSGGRRGGASSSATHSSSTKYGGKKKHVVSAVENFLFPNNNTTAGGASQHRQHHVNGGGAPMAAPLTPSPNRPQEVVKRCGVCYLSFTAKVSPHEAIRAKADAKAVDSSSSSSSSSPSSAVCANCVERALPCEFYRRSCCFCGPDQCDYAHVFIPCPFGAQCINFAVETFSKLQQQQQIGGLVSSISGVSATVGCCPFVHPGEKCFQQSQPPTQPANTSSATTAAPSEEKTEDGSIALNPNHDANNDSHAVSSSDSTTVLAHNNNNNNNSASSSLGAILSETALSSANVSLSALLLKPSLINPTATATATAAKTATRNSAADGAGESSSKTEKTEDNNNKSNTIVPSVAQPQSVNNNKKPLCPHHFYSASGCTLGARCRFSHTPIPLYVPIPVVAAATTLLAPKEGGNK